MDSDKTKDIKNFKNKQILVCGIARSGISAAILLKKLGADVTISDLKEREKIEDEATLLENNDIKLFLGKNPDEIITNFELIIISPGIPYSLPFLNIAREFNIPIWSEVELSYRLSKAPIVAITGTNGKTTTTSLTGDIFKQFNQQAFVVGNIGVPFSEKVLETTEDSIVIAEISSFQMETAIKFKPHVSCVLNITPDHLNRHKTLECYTQMKEKIFINQRENDYTVLNYDDKICRKMAKKSKATIMFFSQKKELEQGVFLKENSVFLKWNGYNEKIVSKKELNVLGNHILEDIMASVCISVCLGVPLDIIRNVLREFKGVEHRIEFVSSVKGIDFFNDSKATNVDAAIKALEAIEKPIILIAGGYDKASEYGEWVKLFNGKVKLLVLLGETADSIIETCKAYNFMDYHKVNTLKDAVEICYSRAEKGDCVLLSPACASFDMFDGYEQRGNIFKEFVYNLAKIDELE